MKIINCRYIFGLVIALLFTPVTTVKADPAILLGTTICQNQRDAMDYQWVLSRTQNLKLFYISGNSPANGTISSVGAPAYNFDDAEHVYISIHGAVNSVANFSGADFATVFHAHHPAAPSEVNMYVCQSGTIPPGVGGVSSMAALARMYPGPAPNSTVIRMTAPAPHANCALRGSAGNAPINPVINIAGAVYRTAVAHTPGQAAILNRLLNDWTDAVNFPYPDGAVPAQSFQSYCQNQRMLDITGQWVDTFVDNVNITFGADYLNLINANYGGNPFLVCDAANPCN